ncbi:non-specific lipid transfer protein GPI-anchored 20-like [Macadamia integrifolia]|uniref:non-specific lipid transfer protein GPI-anchored 20-like n=1 Tax=Macadamia integrifolia TaxID=60698 RepID=UPI001C52E3DF|nr:non-specific lipid transfer protein GPI-anchored 20-like [Macadamia integrifolia]
MEGLKGFQLCFIAISSMALMMSIMPVFGQINTGCTNTMITGFSPCLSYITGSSANGSSPTSACCKSLSSLVRSNMECACLVITGNVPIILPINRTLTVSLPSACNMSSVPLQCKAAGSPLAAPGPPAFGPTLPPTASLSPSPTASAIPESTGPALAPQPETTTGLPPVSSPVSSEGPAAAGIRPVLTPSAAYPSHSSSPFLLSFVIGVVVLNYH